MFTRTYTYMYTDTYMYTYTCTCTYLHTFTYILGDGLTDDTDNIDLCYQFILLAKLTTDPSITNFYFSFLTDTVVSIIGVIFLF
jgi:hypothetical protein